MRNFLTKVYHRYTMYYKYGQRTNGMLAVRLSKDLDDRLTRLALSADRSKSYYVKKALEKFLAEEEERQIAIKAYEKYVSSGKKTYSFEEVMQRNGL